MLFPEMDCIVLVLKYYILPDEEFFSICLLSEMSFLIEILIEEVLGFHNIPRLSLLFWLHTFSGKPSILHTQNKFCLLFFQFLALLLLPEILKMRESVYQAMAQQDAHRLFLDRCLSS